VDRDKLIEYQLELWKTTVETARHFNEMSGRSRQLGLAFVVATLSLAAVLLTKQGDYSFSFSAWDYSFRINISAFLVLIASLAVRTVKTIDTGIYHRMLRGSVSHGEDLESILRQSIMPVEKGLMQSISHFSRYLDASVSVEGESSTYKYHGQKHQTALDKLEKFYRNIFILLICVAVILLVATGDMSKC
jgi:hypothetical protein